MNREQRCPWPGDDELMLRYHDSEWGTPVHDDPKHYEFLVLDGAQAGLSWRTILYKRENYRAVFGGFDPRKVARFDARKVERLLQDPGIVRNRLKVEGAILSAKAFLRVQKEFGSFDAYVWSFTGGRTIMNRWESLRQVPAKTAESEAMSKDLLKRGFKFVGPTICYAYMQAAGMVNDHLTSCFRWRAVQKGA
jgi:DNA-3-methyladenine glycosylase I